MPRDLPPPPTPDPRDRDDARVLAEVNEFRLARNWSVMRLATAMGSAGWPIPYRTLARLLRTDGVSTTGHDRTLYRIRRFLEWVRMTAEVKALEQTQREELLRRRDALARELAS
jgi:hypothetical protein